MPSNTPTPPSSIALGGGCHWCTEGVFVSLRGVVKVDQGWVSAPAPDDSFSEAVIVRYDPAVITLEELIEVHLETHAATVAHPLRHKYRSAVYAFSPEERDRCNHILARLAQQRGQHFVTRALLLTAFRPSPPEYQDYYRTNPDRPFCRRYISPKLDKLRRRKPNLLVDGQKRT